jgi:hypothetical protein
MGVEKREVLTSARWMLVAVTAAILAVVFFWWSIQTAWLGSFPGRDVAYYTFRAYSQLAVGVGFLVFAIYSFVRVGRTKERCPR